MAVIMETGLLQKNADPLLTQLMMDDYLARQLTDSTECKDIGNSVTVQTQRDGRETQVYVVPSSKSEAPALIVWSRPLTSRKRLSSSTCTLSPEEVMGVSAASRALGGISPWSDGREKFDLLADVSAPFEQHWQQEWQQDKSVDSRRKRSNLKNVYSRYTEKQAFKKLLKVLKRHPYLDGDSIKYNKLLLLESSLNISHKFQSQMQAAGALRKPESLEDLKVEESHLVSAIRDQVTEIPYLLTFAPKTDRRANKIEAKVKRMERLADLCSGCNSMLCSQCLTAGAK